MRNSPQQELSSMQGALYGLQEAEYSELVSSGMASDATEVIEVVFEKSVSVFACVTDGSSVAGAFVVLMLVSTDDFVTTTASVTTGDSGTSGSVTVAGADGADASSQFGAFFAPSSDSCPGFESIVTRKPIGLAFSGVHLKKFQVIQIGTQGES